MLTGREVFERCDYPEKTDLLNAGGCFYGLWHWQVGVTMGTSWAHWHGCGELSGRFWEGGPGAVSWVMCVRGRTFPLPSWLQFCQYSGAILPQACKQSSTVKDTLHGLGVSVTWVSPCDSQRYCCTWHCWARRLGWNRERETPRPQSLAVEEATLTMFTRLQGLFWCVIRNPVFETELI